MASLRPTTLKYTVDNFDEFVKADEVRKSNAAEILGLRWTLCVKPVDSNCPDTMIVAFIECERANANSIFDDCEASYEITLLAANDGVANKRGEEKMKTFYPDESPYPSKVHSFGLASFIKEKYAEDGRCSFVAVLSVGVPRGLREFKQLDGDKVLTDDVTFQTGERQVHANKGYLSVVSPVFARMFSGDFREKEADVVQLEDVQPEHFLEFLRVVYPSRKEITSSSVFYLLVLADRFDVVSLMDDCMEYLKKSSNIQPVEKLCFAEEWDFTVLKNQVIESLAYNQIQSVRQSEKFEKLSLATVTDLLDRYMKLKN